MISVSELGLTRDAERDWFRNIVSLRRSQSLVASLVDSEEEAQILIEHEVAVKPYSAVPTATQRPFEFAEALVGIADVILWPFEHPAASRFSDGHFGCWYGGSDLETTIYETGYHFWQDIEDSAASSGEAQVEGQRRVHGVAYTGLLLDLRPKVLTNAGIFDHPTNPAPCRALGNEAHENRLPGFLTYSARDLRRTRGLVAAVLAPDLLVENGVQCFLTYRLDRVHGRLFVERSEGERFMEISLADWTVPG